MVGLLVTHSHTFHENGSLHFIYYCDVQPLQMILVGLFNYINKYCQLASQDQPLYDKIPQFNEHFARNLKMKYTTTS